MSTLHKDDGRTMMTPIEARELLGISRQRLQQMRRRGTLQKAEFDEDERCWMYDRNELLTYREWRKQYHALHNYMPPTRKPLATKEEIARMRQFEEEMAVMDSKREEDGDG